MILFLLSRNRVFKAGLAFACLLPLALLPFRNESLLKSGVLPILWDLCVMFVLLLSPRELASRFEIGLPIAGRQFFWAKAIPLLALIWLPVATCSALVLARGADVSFPLRFAEAGALLTLASVLPLSVFAGRASVSVPAFLALWGLGVLPGGPLMFLLPVPVFLALFGGASLLAFLRAWLAVPASFQVAPAHAVELRSSTIWAVRKPAWWPIWQSAHPWLALLFFPLGLMAGAFPHPVVLTSLLALSNWLPQNSWAAVAIAFAPALAMSFLLERQFRQTELPARPTPLEFS